MNIKYKLDTTPKTNDIIELYYSSGINRPIEDEERITKMYLHSNLIITAWDNEKLVGIARSLTDFCYSCYLSDLAVSKEYQHLGIGKKLVELTREKISDQSMLLLLSAPAAMGYYPKIGLSKVENGFIIKRKQ